MGIFERSTRLLLVLLVIAPIVLGMALVQLCLRENPEVPT